MGTAEGIATIALTHPPQANRSDRGHESEKTFTADSICSLQVTTMDSLRDLQVELHLGHRHEGLDACL